jgi:hypothetical protein
LLVPRSGLIDSRLPGNLDRNLSAVRGLLSILLLAVALSTAPWQGFAWGRGDDEARELWRVSRFYLKEAMRCEVAKAYLAGCVMIGSALETLLILMVDANSAEAEQSGRVPTKKGKPKPLLDWQFAELLRVANAAKILSGNKYINFWVGDVLSRRR